jgi:hypothetical protein
MVIEIEPKELKMIVIALERNYQRRIEKLEIVKDSGDRGMEFEHEVLPIMKLALKLRGIYDEQSVVGGRD